jgi:hypothetical protein
MVGLRWNLEAKRACLTFPGAFKTYANPRAGQNQVILTPKSMNWEGHGWFPGQVRAVPEPECGQSEM